MATIPSLAPFLPSTYGNISLNDAGKSDTPRADRCLQLTKSHLDLPLTRLYMDKFYDEKAMTEVRNFCVKYFQCIEYRLNASPSS